MIWSIYRFITQAVTPLLPFFLRMRLRKGKEDAARISERLGVTNIARPKGKLLWFHAASMGEVASILPLLRNIHAHQPTYNILLTTVTVTSANYVKTRLPAGVIHQFLPLDAPIIVEKFLQYWQPSAAVFVESELWPNLLLAADKHDCQLLLINARISERSFERWKMFVSSFLTLLNKFTLVLAQSELDQQRLQKLGVKSVQMLGNLKHSAPPLLVEAAELEKLRGLLGTRPCWLAASTHPGEEMMVAKVHIALKAKFPDLLTIIVPRHAVRGEAIANELSLGGSLEVALRSAGAEHLPKDIYIADSMGELGLFYSLSEIVFIGGSLVPHGGQNPFEAAHLGCAILYGPYMHNFVEFCTILENARAAKQVASVEELTSVVEDLLKDATRRQGRAERAKMAVAALGGSLEKVEAAIVERLPSSNPTVKY